MLSLERRNSSRLISPESRACGAYLGLAVGDALGATVEFMTPHEIRVHYGTHDTICGDGWLKLPKGTVTDDTTMSLALGGAIETEGTVSALAVAQAFSQWMRDKPVDIGNTVRRGILHFRHSGKPEVPVSEHDAGNGACMRCLPVALATWGLPAQEVRTLSHRQTHVTHNNPLSDAGTDCVIAMVQIALDGGTKADMLNGPVRELLHWFPMFSFRRRRVMNPSGFIVPTLQAVLQAFFDTDDFESCLIDVVNRGGDADTTGAICGMLAGGFYGREAIPRRWSKVLHKGIRDACETQALNLLGCCAR